MLVELVNKIWTTNLQIVDILIRQQTTSVALDTQHTYFQQPVKFEDALGRVLPVPSEYGWGVNFSCLPLRSNGAYFMQKINAIILDQFSASPGHEKVLSGEYELFNSIDTKQTLSPSEIGTLIPGMSVTMAFVIGLYEHQPVKRCPRPGCQTREFLKPKNGRRRWLAIYQF